MILRQSELTIRSTAIADAPLLGRWWRDGKVMSHAGYPHGLLLSNEEVERHLSKASGGGLHIFILEVNQQPVGEMNYRDKGDCVAAIGINICEFNMQEKGLGTRFILMLLKALFKDLGFEKITIDANLDNSRALYVYEKKLFFRKIRETHDHWRDQLGRLQSTVELEMTKAEYLSCHE